MKKIIVLNSLEEAETLNNRLTIDMQPFVTGEKYCNIKKHPLNNLWCIPVEPELIQIFTSSEISKSVDFTDEWRENKEPSIN